MRTLANLALAAALGLGLTGCGGSPEVGDAEVVPAAVLKPAETPADKAAPDVEPGDPPKTAPEGEAPKAP